MSAAPPEGRREAEPEAQMDDTAKALKEALVPLSQAIGMVPAELLQDLCDANLNIHHALGRLNAARAMMRRMGDNA